MKEAPLMKKRFRYPGIRLLLFLLLTGSVWAEGLAVPTEGGVLILDGRSLTEVRALSLGGKETPRLAVHPSSSVMAGLVGEQLIFWNLLSQVSGQRTPSQPRVPSPSAKSVWK